METKYYVFGNDGVTVYPITNDEADDYRGDDTVVTVTEISPKRFRFEIEYYGKEGCLTLEITQPLDPALRTYMALLNADSEINP